MPVKYSVKNKKNISLLEFVIEGGVLGIDELPESVKNAPVINTTKGLCISGRGPIWLYGALLHKYHPTPFLAVYEPRRGTCIIVATHDKKYRIGQEIPIE